MISLTIIISTFPELLRLSHYPTNIYLLKFTIETLEKGVKYDQS